MTTEKGKPMPIDGPHKSPRTGREYTFWPSPYLSDDGSTQVTISMGPNITLSLGTIRKTASGQWLTVHPPNLGTFETAAEAADAVWDKVQHGAGSVAR